MTDLFGAPDLSDEFADWYAGYNRKKEPGKARKAYTKARRMWSAVQLTEARDNYQAELKAEGTEAKFQKYPATFLNQVVGDYLEPATVIPIRAEPVPPPGKTRFLAGTGWV